MSGRRGRPKQIVNSNRATSVKHRQPHLQLKRINTETMSVHEMSDDAESIADSNQLHSYSRQKPGPKPRSMNENTDINQLLLSIKSDTAATMNEIRSTRTELKSDIRQLTSQTERKFKSIDDRLAKTNGDIKSLFARMSNIERGAPPASNNTELQKQILLRNNIAISGMPIEPNENLSDIVDWIFDGLGLPALKEGELVRARRIPNSKTKLIIASFRDFELKSAVMQRKVTKRISLSDLFELRAGESNPPIFINNHLTPFYSNLSFHGRNAMANKQIHSFWISSRGFLVKLNEDSNPIVVETAQQFDDFLKENGRAMQRKRDRSSDMDPSPSTSRATKIKASRRTASRDAMNQLDAATKSMNISVDTDIVAPSAGHEGGDSGTDLELDKKVD